MSTIAALPKREKLLHENVSEPQPNVITGLNVLLVQLRVSSVLASPRTRAADLLARKAAPSASGSSCPLWVTVGSLTYRAPSGSAGLLQEKGDSAAGLEGRKPLRQAHCSFPRDPCFSCQQAWLAPQKGLFTDTFVTALLPCLLKLLRSPLTIPQPLPTAQQYCKATSPLNSPCREPLHQLPGPCQDRSVRLTSREGRADLP